MALRVLLADESSTIKKVFQLALQDFAVDVRPVNVGTDVPSVAEDFQPDIIFADVLLQKRNGYEVTSELKQSAALQAIPVVLMWSGFMELDEDKFQASHANARLEKPFDVATLRKLVNDLVPKTQSQRLSQFLAFPKLPEFDEPRAAGVPAVPEPKPLSEEDFQQVSIPKMKGAADKHRLNLTPAELDPDAIPVDVDEVLGLGESEDADHFTMRAPHTMAPPPAPQPPPPPVTAAPREIEAPPEIPAPVMASVRRPAAAVDAMIPETVPSLSEAKLEAIVREQSLQAIEQLVWKIVPDLAAQIIERELNRLLKDREAPPY